MPEANQNARLEAFCDGVFAIAITLLIIDIKVPPTEDIDSVPALWAALGHILPSILAFVMSFIIILITWVNHHNAFKLVNRSSAAFMYANGVLLLSVVFLPFPTSFIGEYILTDHAAPAVIVYSLVLVLQSIGWALLCSAVLKGGLYKNEKAAGEIRRNRTYAYYSLAGYGTLAVLSAWFPVPIVIITSVLWAVWLVVGIRIKHEE